MFRSVDLIIVVCICVRDYLIDFFDAIFITKLFTKFVLIIPGNLTISVFVKAFEVSVSAILFLLICEAVRCTDNVFLVTDTLEVCEPYNGTHPC